MTDGSYRSTPRESTLKLSSARTLHKLTRTRRSSILAALVLALGIGTGTAMFALLDVALLERLPYREADELVHVWATDRRTGGAEASVSHDDYRAIATRVRAAEQIAYFSTWFPILATDEGPRQVRVARTSATLFETLGVPPVRGSVFTDGESPRVILGHRLSRQLFGATDELPREAIVLDGTPYTVVGVMPEGFSYPPDTEAWVPAGTRSSSGKPVRDGSVVARLRDGFDIRSLQAELEAVAAALPELDPTWTADRGLRAVSLYQQLTSQVRNILLLLVGAVGLFFLIACLSASQLLFVENLSRRQEFAVRAALGARRIDLRGQLFAEAARAAALAAALGAVLAVVLIEAVRRVLPPDLPRLATVHFDSTVLLVLLTLGTLAALAVAFLSGWRLTGGDVAGGLAGDSLRGLGGRSAKPGPVRGVLTATITAGILLLAFGAVSVVLEMWRVTRADLGFDAEGVFTAKICPPEGLTAGFDPAYRTIRDASSAVPGIRIVAVADELPIGSHTTAETFIDGVEGFPEVRVRKVSSDYFEALDIPVVEGRPFPARPGEGGKVALVNRALAEKFWPGRSAIGQQLMGSWDPDREWITIVGVTADVRRSAMDREDAPEVFVPFAAEGAECGTLLVATDRGGSGRIVRDHLRETAGSYLLSDVTSLETLLLDQLWRPRLRAAVLGLFGVLALVFGAVALYTTLRQIARSRHKELATRAALGATPRELVATLLGSHTLPIGLGIALGAIASALAVRLVGASYHGIETIDGSTLALVAGLLALTAFAASIGPALRAGRVDVMRSLREEQAP